MLSEEEKQLFVEAKHKEITNWLNTGTVSKTFRNQLNPEQILRCRWTCGWKPLEESGNTTTSKSSATHHKANARLVVLGFLDPDIDTIARDSPRLGRQARMLILQLISSMSWTLRSFDIKAAFLQGKTQDGRVLGLEPVPEMRTALSLKETKYAN